MKSLPLPIRLAAGLAATVVEKASKLPEEIAGLPVTMASQALQLSMRVQQRVTELAIKGDEALAGLRPAEDQPDWATFDEDDVDGGTNATVHDFLRRERPADTADDEDLVAGRSGADQPSAGSVRGGPEVDSIEPDLRLRTPSRPRPTGLRRQPTRDADTAGAEDAAGSATAGSEDTRSSEDIGGSGETARSEDTAVPAETAQAAHEPKTSLVAQSAAPAGLAGYDEMSVAQVRGKLRTLSLAQLDELLDYERAHQARERFVTMLSNRMRTVRAADQ